MKLPNSIQIGMGGVAHSQNKAPEIRASYSTLARGLDGVSDALAQMEYDRLDQQAQDAAHEYEVNSINMEAREFSKQFYDVDDPALDGLENIKRTELRVNESGDVEEIPRSQIPADEVWPELISKTREGYRKASEEKIESEWRRTNFSQKAEEARLNEELRLATRTSEMQYQRGVEQREWMVQQYRTIGRWDKIDEVIGTIKDDEERRALSEWARETKVTDDNTEVIGKAVKELDAKTLENKWQEYLGYMGGDESYNGPLDPEQLQQEANRFKQYMNQVNTLTNADTQMFVGKVKYDARQLITAMNNGYPVRPEEVQRISSDLSTAFTMKGSDDESLYTLMRDADQAQKVSGAFRDIITNIPAGHTFNDILEQQTAITQSNRSDLSVENRNVMHAVNKRLGQFQGQLNADPLGTLKAYGLDSEYAPIEDIDVRDIDSLQDALAGREDAYDYYSNIYDFNGDILRDTERGDLNDLLADETLSNDDRLGIIIQASIGLERYGSKFWGPSISDSQAGKYAAVASVVKDHIDTGNPNRGIQVAKNVMRGFERWAHEPTLIEDYEDLRNEARSELMPGYLEYPNVVNNYLDAATAYMMSQATRNPRNSDMRDAFQAVTGGTIEQGRITFLSPAAGVDQRAWEEYIEEYDPSNIKEPIHNWSNEQFLEGIQDGDIQLKPTGSSRSQFFAIDQVGRPLRHTNGSNVLFTYDPNAEKRRP